MSVCVRIISVQCFNTILDDSVRKFMKFEVYIKVLANEYDLKHWFID